MMPNFYSCSVCTSVILGGTDDLAEEESRLIQSDPLHLPILIGGDYVRDLLLFSFLILAKILQW